MRLNTCWSVTNVLEMGGKTEKGAHTDALQSFQAVISKHFELLCSLCMFPLVLFHFGFVSPTSTPLFIAGF